MKKLFKNDKRLKALVITLIITTVSLFGVSYTVFAKTSGSASDGVKTTSSTPTNDENVYVMTKATGDSYQRIVSEDGTLHYKGYDSYTLPISMKITYTLDGKSVTPKELAGAEGHVVIHISYTNNIRSGGVNVPFMVVTGMALDNDHFSNIKIDNGKTMDDGTRNMVMGYAFPGMQSSLGLSSSTVSIPESVTISCDTDKYDVDTMYTVVTNEPFKDLNINGTDSLNQIKSKLKTLMDGIAKLQTGTETMYNGSVKLASAANKISTASSQLSAGAKTLYAGTTKLSENASLLLSGTTQLVAGTKSVYDGSVKANAGAGSLASGASTLASGSKSVSDGATTLSTGLKTLSGKSTALNTATAGVVSSVKASSLKQLQASLDTIYKAIGKTAPTVTESNYAAVIDQTVAALKAVGGQDATVTALQTSEQTMKATFASLDTYASSVSAYTAGVDSASTGASTLSAGADKVTSGAASLSTGAKTLASGTASLESGSKQVYDGAQAMLSGGPQLVAGAKALNDGTMKVYQGTVQFSSKEAEFATGAQTLSKGYKTLYDGINSAVKQATSKLSSLSSSDLMAVAKNAESISNAAKSYNSFGGNGSYNSVTFIYKADEVAPK